MNTSKSALIERITHTVQKDGGRMTNARKALALYLSKQSVPSSIQHIVEGSGLDEVGVYRNIAYFMELGFVEEILLADGVKTYALTEEHHDHVVCRKCDFVGHIPCEGKTTHAHIQHKGFKKVDSHTLTYYGVCAKCAG